MSARLENALTLVSSCFISLSPSQLERVLGIVMLAATYGQVSDIPVLFNIKLNLFPGGHLHPEAGVHACWMVGHLHPIVCQLLILHKAVHLTDCPCLQLFHSFWFMPLSSPAPMLVE